MDKKQYKTTDERVFTDPLMAFSHEREIALAKLFMGVMSTTVPHSICGSPNTVAKGFDNHFDDIMVALSLIHDDYNKALQTLGYDGVMIDDEPDKVEPVTMANQENIVPLNLTGESTVAAVVETLKDRTYRIMMTNGGTTKSDDAA